MNSIILIAEVVQPPQLRYTQDQTPISEIGVQFPGTRDNDPPSQLKVIGWGDLAQRLQEECHVGKQYLLEGRLQMNLVQRPEGFKEKTVVLWASGFGPGTGVLNSVHLVGRAGGEPTLKYFDSGNVVCNFSIAVNRRSRKNDTDWFDLSAWDRTAQIAADYVQKGSLVGITGSLKFEHWTDRNTGVQRSKPVIRVAQLDLLGGKQD